MARLLAARKAEIASDPEFISTQKNKKIDAQEVPEANEKVGSVVGGMGYRRSDILSRLVIASETEGNKGLRDEELVSYIFVHRGFRPLSEFRSETYSYSSSQVMVSGKPNRVSSKRK